MKRKNLQPLVLCFVFVVFACLFVSGAPRLIGHADETPVQPPRMKQALSAQICAEPAPQAQSGLIPLRGQQTARQTAEPTPAADLPEICVCSDANGNVLTGQNYLHAVYRAFALGDGFV